MVGLSRKIDKTSAFHSVQEYLESQQFSIYKKDNERPWGGFFVIDDRSLTSFIHHFFAGIDLKGNENSQILSPKILIVKPGERLSWQYHHRRSEIWKIIHGPIGIIQSDNDNQQPVRPYNTGELVTINQGQRHRLIGLQDWGVIAEIWQHTDPENPSDEYDIVRLDDDYGR